MSKNFTENPDMQKPACLGGFKSFKVGGATQNRTGDRGVAVLSKNHRTFISFVFVKYYYIFKISYNFNL